VSTPLADALRDAAAALADAGVPDPGVDAELLLAHGLDVPRGRMRALVAMGADLDDDARDRFERLVARRARREPLQHITGLAPFRSLELRVGPGVFVPRPETERVAQLAIDELRALAVPEPVAVDLGTGSGAIALAVASEVPHARVHAVEVSLEALAWAEENLRRLGLDNASVVGGDIATALPELDGAVDVVVSNPPYIPRGMVPRDPEVRLFDPARALYGGADGLDVVRAVSATARRLTRPGALVVIEHGEAQGAAIRSLLEDDGWRAPRTHPDLTGRDRATVARR